MMLSLVCTSRKLMTPLLMFAAYAALYKACGSSKNSTSQELETDPTHRCWGHIVGSNTGYSVQLISTVSHTLP